jgi:hypothetical protein
MLGGDETRLRAQQRLDIALDIEEVDGALGNSPLHAVGRTPGQAGYPQRLVDTGHCNVAVRHRGVAPIGAAHLEHPHPRRSRARLWRSVATRLPIRLDRITDRGAAIGLSTLIGSALPAVHVPSGPRRS